MSNDESKMQLVFAPGCFDNFEGTQEELQELIDYITKAFESGELMDTAESIDVDDIDDPELIEQIMANTPSTRTLH